MRQPEADDVLHVGVKSGRVSLQHHVDQTRQKVVSIGRLAVGAGESLEDVLAALGHAQQLVLRRSLGIHLNYGWWWWWW